MWIKSVWFSRLKFRLVSNDYNGKMNATGIPKSSEWKNKNDFVRLGINVDVTSWKCTNFPHEQKKCGGEWCNMGITVNYSCFMNETTTRLQTVLIQFCSASTSFYWMKNPQENGNRYKRFNVALDSVSRNYFSYSDSSSNNKVRYHIESGGRKWT